MNYLLIYNQLINKAKLRGLDKTKLPYYVEAHHIIPTCINGPDTEENRVLLTFKEHFMAHTLLCFIYTSGDSKYKMLHAFNGMRCWFNPETQERVRIYSNRFKVLKEQALEAQKVANKLGASKGGKAQPREVKVSNGKRVHELYPELALEHGKTGGKFLSQYLKEHPEHQSEAGKKGGKASIQKMPKEAMSRGGKVSGKLKAKDWDVNGLIVHNLKQYARDNNLNYDELRYNRNSNIKVKLI